MSNKVVLSRKGFDSSNGGIANFIFENMFIPIPIPEVGSGVRYEELAFDKNTNFLKVLLDLNCWKYTECHLDPDLKKDIIKRNVWKPLFGQCDQAAVILKDVDRGSVILFYGWFREIEKVNGAYRYIHSAKDKHCIYGYMRVKEKHTISQLNENQLKPFGNHPHVLSSKYKKIDYKNNGTNIVFEAVDNEYGFFEFSKNLILTAEGSDRRSIWELPMIFDNQKFNGHFNKKIENEKIHIEWIGRNNQELLVTDSHEIVEWAEELIKNNNVY